eukprot:TRINITY_DN18614_c0_g1_i1.p1 TRINITY_DN18614_c0_g1~~TRINITY_DN18614_c0_g1_i1.p1  ORF type:complete len:122 (-),score=4.89 TRINITY_DN18614_c0_g1_i1:120-461(-)
MIEPPTAILERSCLLGQSLAIFPLPLHRSHACALQCCISYAPFNRSSRGPEWCWRCYYLLLLWLWSDLEPAKYLMLSLVFLYPRMYKYKVFLDGILPLVFDEKHLLHIPLCLI